MCYVVFDIYVDDFKKISYLFNFDFIEREDVWLCY